MRYVPKAPPRRGRPESSLTRVKRLASTEADRGRLGEMPFDPEAPREHWAKPHHFALNARFRAAPASLEAATELVLFIENTSHLSPMGPSGQGRSVVLNALRKWRSGDYDPERAVTLFGYLAEAGAREYTREFGGDWKTMFTPATRRLAAAELEESFRTQAANGEFDHL